jgi:hypothetical protein
MFIVQIGIEHGIKHACMYPGIKHGIKHACMLPWIPEPSTVNNKLKRREGSGSTGRFFD